MPDVQNELGRLAQAVETLADNSKGHAQALRDLSERISGIETGLKLAQAKKNGAMAVLTVTGGFIGATATFLLDKTDKILAVLR